MSWLKQFFSRGRQYAELSEETREHIEEKTAELILPITVVELK